MHNLGKTFFICLLLFNSVNVNGQLLDSTELANATLYRSLEEALINPDSVFKLTLKRKKLVEVPFDIFKFKNLQELDLSKNKLTVLPREIGTLSNLEYLNVCKNKLTNVPSEIGQLKNLKKLLLFQNEITHLPEEIGGLQSLEFLDLWGNELISLPEELAQLERLAVIDLRVIEISDERQKAMKEMLPHTKIHFSNSCNCGEQ